MSAINKKIKILHLISDDKFIDGHIDKFKSDDFNNTFLYLKEKNTYCGKYINWIKHINPNGYYQIIENIKSFDIIFTNGIGYKQSVFLNSLPNDCPKIFWCFFGAEIYNNPKIWNQKKLYAPITQKKIQNKSLYRLFQKIYHFRFFLKNGNDIHSEIKNTISICDYFTWYSKEEYELIQQNIKFNLPEFKYLPIIHSIDNIKQQYFKKDNILLGNSGSESNNHLDILKKIKETKCNYRISIPFSYGIKKWYKKEIVKFINNNHQLKIRLIEDFVPYEEYILNFEEAKAAVYGSYRQMGLGNIVMCIRSGVKMYLSDKNPIYQWLKNNDVSVCSIESELRNDILVNNLQLSQDEIKKNKINWNKIVDRQNKEQFIEMIRSSIK